MEEIPSAGRSLSPLSIRPMRMADLDRVLAIAAQLPTAPHWTRQAYVDALNAGVPEASTRPQRLALVAEAGGALLGFLLIRLLPPEAELESIAVAPEAQRRGVAGHLLQSALAAIRAAGARTLLLEIRASNHPAAALYRRAGFVAIGRRPGYYSRPVEDAILMQLNLG